MKDTSLEAFIESGFPFHRQLGVKVCDINEESVILYIPFKEELVGHAAKRIVHGGVISSLVDICGGFSVWSRCQRDDHVTTITLTVDFLRPAVADDIYAEARVRLLRNKVGNAHVVVWTKGSPDDHVAVGRGVYNIRRSD